MTDRSVTSLIPEAEGDLGLGRAVSFQLLWQEGRPVDPTEIAADAGLELEEVMEELDRVESEGRITRNSSGRVIGSGGLTVVPTTHALVLGHRVLWAWCAVDAVGIMGAVEAAGVVLSSSAETGQSLTLTFDDGKLQPSDVAVFLATKAENCRVVDEWCPTVNFFEDMWTAEAWARRTKTSGEIHSAMDIAEPARDAWRALLEVAHQAKALASLDE